MTIGEILALIAVATNLIAAIIGLTWGVGKIKEQLEEKLLIKLVQLVASSVMESELKMERVTGEVGAALREKIVQVEFFVRDNYVRQKDFDSMIRALEARFDRLQEGLEKLGDKIDNRNGRGQEHE